MSFIKLWFRTRKVIKLYKLLYTLNATFDEASAKSYLKSNVKNLDTLNWAETKRLVYCCLRKQIISINKKQIVL